MTHVPTPKTRVMLLFGGRSAEHSISCVTAGGILAALDRERFEAVAVGVTSEGAWVEVDPDPSALAMRGRELPRVAAGGPEIVLPRQAGDRVVRRVGAGGVLEPWAHIDVVFPVLHGPYGEDGTIQGALDLIDMPYVGSGLIASAMGMDKVWMKAGFAAQGLRQGDFVAINAAEWRDARTSVLRRIAALGLPVFVKPARAGSSFGISRVTSLDRLGEAIALAQKFDAKVIVEAQVPGRELECAVLGSPEGLPPRTTWPGEVALTSSSHDFYDFEAKYLDPDSVSLTIPADVPDDVARLVRELAARAFLALGCEGLARVDFFYDEATGEVYVNEINTMPGFTPISMYPALWAHEGMSYSDLLTELITLALTRNLGLH